MIGRPPRPTLFPSPTLSRSPELVVQPAPGQRVVARPALDDVEARGEPVVAVDGGLAAAAERGAHDVVAAAHVHEDGDGRARLDRKSTRLNSSHANISYAVFC